MQQGKNTIFWKNGYRSQISNLLTVFELSGQLSASSSHLNASSSSSSEAKK